MTIKKIVGVSMLSVCRLAILACLVQLVVLWYPVFTSHPTVSIPVHFIKA